jgi:hypothetical protein
MLSWTLRTAKFKCLESDMLIYHSHYLILLGVLKENGHSLVCIQEMMVKFKCIGSNMFGMSRLPHLLGHAKKKWLFS